MTTMYKVVITADNPDETNPKLITYSSQTIAMTAEEIAELEAARPTEEEINRTERELLLAETDHLAISDRPISQAMLDYRQALRDITTHANWPNLQDSDWPTKPE